MRIQLTTACLLGTLLLPSCNVMKQRVDLSWFSDVMASPQNDSVDVEAGTGLPEAAAEATTAATLAATQAATEAGTAVATAQAPAAAAATAVTTAAKTYTIAKGDTLNAIAARCKCTPQALAAANGITDPRKLQIGQVLTLPGTETVQAAVQPVVQPVAAVQAATTPPTSEDGTAAWKIWRQNAPTPTVAAAAPVAATAAPVAAAAAPLAAAAAPLYYTVQQGDTMSSIARNHGISLSSLLTANKMTMQQAGTLSIGQRIALPAAH